MWVERNTRLPLCGAVQSMEEQNQEESFHSLPPRCVDRLHHLLYDAAEEKGKLVNSPSVATIHHPSAKTVSTVPMQNLFVVRHTSFSQMS